MYCPNPLRMWSLGWGLLSNQGVIFFLFFFSPFPPQWEAVAKALLATRQMGPVGLLWHVGWGLSPSPVLLRARCWGPRWLRKFLCAYCPGKVTFRQSSSWGGEGGSFPNRDRFDYKSPVLMPGFPRSVILHAGEARELLKNNVPTHQSSWRHVRELLQAGRLKEACERAWRGGYTGTAGSTSSAGSTHRHPKT